MKKTDLIETDAEKEFSDFCQKGVAIMLGIATIESILSAIVIFFLG